MVGLDGLEADFALTDLFVVFCLELLVVVLVLVLVFVFVAAVSLVETDSFERGKY